MEFFSYFYAVILPAGIPRPYTIQTYKATILEIQMQLFYAPGISLPEYTLSEEESAHCMKVLRLGTGDELFLTDGRGNLYRAAVTVPDAKRCRVRITDTFPEYGRRSYGLTVAVAPTKNADRYEWFLEKATETGIDRIIPIECRHSERRTLRRDRGERVVTSAVKQSLKAYHPQLDELTSLADVIGMPFDGTKLIAHCRPAPERKFIGEAVRKGGNTLVLIGPEGDFTEEEIAAAQEAGFIPVSLGESRLRTETAALAAVTVVAFINGME